jgi:hypothetical protein
MAANEREWTQMRSQIGGLSLLEAMASLLAAMPSIVIQVLHPAPL